MGGFANLKNDFDQWFKVLDPFTNGTKGPIEKQQQDVFRFLYLRSLFEIAGNLDTIALCSRASVEQLEKTRIAIEENKVSERVIDELHAIREIFEKEVTMARAEIDKREKERREKAYAEVVGKKPLKATTGNPSVK